MVEMAARLVDHVFPRLRVRQWVLRWFSTGGYLDKEDAKDMAEWANGGGFSLAALARIEGHNRAGMERLLRDCARPPFALERLEALDEQRLIDRFPKPRPDGRTSVTLAPLELIQRLAWQNSVGSLQAIPGAASSLC
jgi:hypothetical protein